MDLVGKEIIHETFGEGKIIKDIDNYLTIQFEIGEKNFVFPDAFKSFLKFKNKEDTKILLPDINDKFTKKLEIKRERRKLSEKRRMLNIKVYDYKNAITKKKTKSSSKPKRIKQDSSNIVFKCNFCNGGHSSEQVGFNGICSDDMIKANITVENSVWCKSEESPCFKYYNNDITREELDSIFEIDEAFCYESTMLKDWKAYAGVVQSGKNKGKPKKLARARNNSLCVLTTRDPQTIEDTRYIFAVFLIDEFNEGNEIKEGYVGSKSKYKVKLSPEEAGEILFWNYYSNNNNPQNISWNSGLHRYIYDEQAAQILKDIAEVKKGTKDEKLANEFLKYYCDINKIDIKKIKELKGALIQEDALVTS
ncbi:MAG: hypothetical protein PHY91_09680 [Tissierellia bacterium]|nr:hypothetical protein [Tissierellia bacterium]MDD4726330.1 hypothetical protein [Tissierellia bacterium]